jgi:hypothetical protein
VVGLEVALDRGHRTFLVASLTYAKDMRATILAAAEARNLQVRIVEIDPTA